MIRTSYNIKLLIPIILIIAAILWVLYTGIIKKDWKVAIEFLKPTLFFAAIWAIIYYFIFN